MFNSSAYETEQEREKSRKLDDALKSIQLLNIDNDFLLNDQDDDEEKEPTEDLESKLSHFRVKGISFFNTTPCIWDLKNANSIEGFPHELSISKTEFMQLLLIGDLTKKLKKRNLKIRDMKLMKYILKILFCNLTQPQLQNVCDALLYLLSRNKSLVLPEFTQILDECLINTGVNHKMLPCSVVLPCEDSKIDGVTFEANNNLKFILDFISYAVESQKKYFINCSSESLNNLLIRLIIMGLDPYIIQNLYFKIQNILSNILSLYNEDDFVNTHIFKMVEEIDRLWEEDNYPHTSALYVCSSLLKPIGIGIYLRKCLAYYSIQCCLNLEDVYVTHRVTMSLITKLIHKNFDGIAKASLPCFSSIIYFFDICVTRPVIEKKDKDALDTLIKSLNSLLQFKNANKEVGEFLVEGQCRAISEEWTRLLGQHLPISISADSSDSDMEVYQ